MLRAEIDMPNPDSKLLPGMYAYGMVKIERPVVFALPQAAITEVGDLVCCYVLEGGKAVRTPLQTGIRDGTRVEVVKKQVKGDWADFTGSEGVILGDLTELVDGQPVIVARPNPVPAG